MPSPPLPVLSTGSSQRRLPVAAPQLVLPLGLRTTVWLDEKLTRSNGAHRFGAVPFVVHIVLLLLQVGESHSTVFKTASRGYDSPLRVCMSRL